MNNKIYLVGAGPGEVDLITLKAKKLIETADCIIYDRLVNKEILDFASKNAQLIYLGKENTEGGEIQDLINKTLVESFYKYNKVVRLKGGDPFVFGRGGEEIEYLIENNIEFEIVPGITSAISVPTYAGIPVTHRNIARSFHVFTGHTMENGKWHNFDAIAKLEGTLIFLMSVKNLNIIVDDLIKNGKDKKTPVAIIENGSLETQRVTSSNLENICELARKNNVKAPAIIIIGETVNFRESFKWFEKKTEKKIEKKSKKNKKLNILITRDKNQIDEFENFLKKFSNKIYKMPFIDIIFKKNIIKIKDIEKYSCILFNSPNGVRSFLENLSERNFLKKIKIGAVGEKTKEILEENKIKVDFVPEKYMVDNLAAESVNYTREKDNILIITSDISPCNTDMYNRLYNRNFEKNVLYETKKVKYNKTEVMEKLNEVDAIIFLSSSTVEAFYESIDGDIELVKDKKIISIGPATTKTIKHYLMEVFMEAKKYSLDGIKELLENN